MTNAIESASIPQESALGATDQADLKEIEEDVQALLSRIEDIAFEGQSYPIGTITPGEADTIGAYLRLHVWKDYWLSDNQAENLYILLQAWLVWGRSMQISCRASDQETLEP